MGWCCSDYVSPVLRELHPGPAVEPARPVTYAFGTLREKLERVVRCQSPGKLAGQDPCRCARSLTVRASSRQVGSASVRPTQQVFGGGEQCYRPHPLGGRRWWQLQTIRVRTQVDDGRVRTGRDHAPGHPYPLLERVEDLVPAGRRVTPRQGRSHAATGDR